MWAYGVKKGPGEALHPIHRLRHTIIFRASMHKAHRTRLVLQGVESPGSAESVTFTLHRV
jgi:hypothetical protein